MLFSKKISETSSFSEENKLKGKKIGFVPTMGALHQGHVSLINAAKKENDLVICSVFVNPIQFNNAQDLAKYPRTLERDSEMLEKAGCDFLFNPEVNEMYPEKAKEDFDFGSLETVMEGKFRPGHFKGVAIVVSRLFNIVKPDNAYFGLKDYQQVAIIKELVKQKNIPVNIVACPTLRETDGLAMSSRNVHLNIEERNEALKIYKTLNEIKHSKELISVADAIDLAHKHLNSSILKQEYFEIVNPETLQSILSWNEHPHPVICAAVWCGKTRLIDNIIL